MRSYSDPNGNNRALGRRATRVHVYREMYDGYGARERVLRYGDRIRKTSKNFEKFTYNAVVLFEEIVFFAYTQNRATKTNIEQLRNVSPSYLINVENVKCEYIILNLAIEFENLNDLKFVYFLLMNPNSCESNSERL